MYVMPMLRFVANGVKMKDGELSGPSTFTSHRCTLSLVLLNNGFPARRHVMVVQHLISFAFAEEQN